MRGVFDGRQSGERLLYCGRLGHDFKLGAGQELERKGYHDVAAAADAALFGTSAASAYPGREGAGQQVIARQHLCSREQEQQHCCDPEE